MASGTVDHVNILPIDRGGTGAYNKDSALRNLCYVGQGNAPINIITIPYGVYICFLFRYGTGNVYSGNHILFNIGVNRNSDAVTLNKWVTGNNAPTVSATANSSAQTITIKVDSTTNYYGIACIKIFD